MINSKQKKSSKELLEAANKVYHYRRDVISEEAILELDRLVCELNTLIAEKSSPYKSVDSSMDRLDAHLRNIGGKIYPKTFWSDNLEVALVAAIIVIGIRTFFFQPFIIPTNSMYPTYSGMNTVVYEDKNDAPNLLSKAARFITLGARHKFLIAKNNGRLQVGGVEMVKGKKWFFLPTVLAEYTFLVGGVPHKLRVPADFDMSVAIRDSYPDSRFLHDGKNRNIWDLGTTISAGNTILRFDITLGDALFVDRLSYHFKKPSAGDPFVFRTKEIPGIEGGANNIVDKYYIKRIGGIGGESIEINEGSLLVNGVERNEVEPFVLNARREGEYNGYKYPNKNSVNPPKLMTEQGDSVTIPNGNFVALGDNSGNSLDSRYWGFVPEKSVIGRAIFIYYPFTKRWGISE